MNKNGYKRNRIPNDIGDWIGYNDEEGFLYWKKAIGIHIKAGRVIKRKELNNVASRVMFRGKEYFQHRIVYYLAYNVQPNQVRFKDGARDNINIDNLQVVFC